MLSIQPYDAQISHYGKKVRSTHKYNGRRGFLPGLTKNSSITKKPDYNKLWNIPLVLTILAAGCYIYAAYCQYMGNKEREEYIKTLETAAQKTTNNTFLYE